MQADLLFNIDTGHELVTEAIVALEEPVIEEWPIDAVNQELANAYQESMALPWLELTDFGYRVVGSDGGAIEDFSPDSYLLLPVDPVNEAIHRLMGQGGWPTDMAIYLYPVRKGDGGVTDGLWLADSLDGVGDDPDLDDVVFRMVRDANHNRHTLKKFPQFQPRRFTI